MWAVQISSFSVRDLGSVDTAGAPEVGMSRGDPNAPAVDTFSLSNAPEVCVTLPRLW